MTSFARNATKKLLLAAAHPRQAKNMLAQARHKRQIDLDRKRDYVKWFERQSLSHQELETQRVQAKRLASQPLVSILLPIYNTPEKYLRMCIDSVLNQTYENWELCIADDASTTGIVEVVKEYAKIYKNINWTRLAKNQHIAVSSNEALKLASGEYIALLDHDDLLLPNALFEMVTAINANPDGDLFYSDEDKIEAGKGHCEPFFKPDWSPDFLLSCNYITHFAVIRKSVVDEIGGFRDGTEGAQDWDLFLRITSKTQKVVHVPRILYSWRKSPTSTAKTAQSKPYAYINQLRVLRDYVAGNNIKASTLASVYRGFWRVKYHVQNAPLVSIIIPTKDNFFLIKACLESIIEGTTYANFEIIVVDTGSKDRRVDKLYNSKLVTANNVKILRWVKPFNFSAVCNYGAGSAKGDYLLFLNNDTTVITPEWIENLIEHAQRPNVGMVGCKLLFPNNRIQHAGVVLDKNEIARHPFYNSSPELDIFTNIYISNIRNVSAVTAACSMVAKIKFESVGGFEEKLKVTYNDVDLCLKLLDAGYYNVYTPYVELYHYESMSIGKIDTKRRDTKELDAARTFMNKHWGNALRRDAYYNDNFASNKKPYSL